MPELSQIPPQAWFWIDLLFNLTMAAAGIWLAVTVFVIWRRSASNLTPVSDVSKNRRAQPDFLKVNEKARREAMARGEAFDRELDTRDRDEAEQLRRKGRHKGNLVQRLAGLVSLLMAVFTLASMVVSTIWQVGFMGSILEQYAPGERLLLVVQKHPVGVAIAVLVIAYHVFRFFSDRKWEQED